MPDSVPQYRHRYAFDALLIIEEGRQDFQIVPNCMYYSVAMTSSELIREHRYKIVTIEPSSYYAGRRFIYILLLPPCGKHMKHNGFS